MPVPPPELPITTAAAEAADAQAPYVAEIMKESDEMSELMDVLRTALKLRAGGADMGTLCKMIDKNRSGTIDLAEFARVVAQCKLGLHPSQVARLFTAFDYNGSGTISYEQLLHAVRGKMSAPRKALVIAAFRALDATGSGNGVVTIVDIEAKYNASKHPEVVGGSTSKHAVRQELTDGLSRQRAQHDDVVTLADFLQHYEDVSANTNSDDYFGAMMQATWGHLTDSHGKPAVEFVSSHDVDMLEAILFETTYRKKGGSHHAQERLLIDAFKQFDANGNGLVDKPEFLRAMERFGLPVRGKGRAGIGGLPQAVVFALFDRYDTDASGTLSFREFSSVFLKRHQTTSNPIEAEEYTAITAREMERVGDLGEDLEAKLRHPRQKQDHELMAARPLAGSAYLSGAIKVHGVGKAAKKHSGAPFR